MQAMIGAFQRIVGGNLAFVNSGLLLEHLRVLSGKVFRDVKGANPTVVVYWIESVERILEQMACSNEEKLAYTICLLNSETHHWWNTVRKGIAPDRLT